MDKYQENTMLRADLQNVLGRLGRVIASVEDDCTDWHEIHNARETIMMVNKFYGFKGETV